MIKRLLFFGVLCVLMALPGLPAQNVSSIVGDTFEETAGSGLAIFTKPPGVTVFIDGVERGQTPFSINTLALGEHTIRLRKSGYRGRRFRVTLSGKSRLSVSIEMEPAAGLVQVNIQRAEGSPADLPLEPIIDGGGGEVGANIFNLPIGLRTIRVRAFGWEEVSQRVFVREHYPARVDIIMKPAVFALTAGTVSRRRFNPKNPGALGINEFRFNVSAPGYARARVRDESGKEVYSRRFDSFTTWSQGGAWNGRDYSGEPLPEGRYIITIQGAGTADNVGLDDAGTFKDIVLETWIDYSLDIFPLTLTGGIPGLLFAPVPAALPAGSFQIEAALFFGSFSAPERSVLQAADKAFSLLPFEAGLRFSPVDRFELSAAFNMNPGFGDGDDAGGESWGFSGSAKYVFLKGSVPLEMAAGISYAWAQSGGEVPLGAGRGGGLYLPMSLNAGMMKVIFSPGLRWPGPDDPIPRLLLSAGALFRWNWLTVGLSLRPELDFSTAGDRAGVSFAEKTRALYGAEIKLYPPPSNLVYTFSGGVWQRGSSTGGFGGIGIGLLY